MVQLVGDGGDAIAPPPRVTVKVVLDWLSRRAEVVVIPLGAILVGERDSRCHLRHVRGGVVGVGVFEAPAQCRGEGAPHRALSGSGDTHQDQDAGSRGDHGASSTTWACSTRHARTSKRSAATNPEARPRDEIGSSASPRIADVELTVDC